ncbi:MAG: hypothetical protein IKB51_06230 [Clostridia bacterium]|nr:hypothetical protein [Clostridia bacterium]
MKNNCNRNYPYQSWGLFDLFRVNRSCCSRNAYRHQCNDDYVAERNNGDCYRERQRGNDGNRCCHNK